MSTMVRFASKASKGGQLEGALAEPSGGGKVGALLVIQEWHGVTDQMKGKTDRFAQAGYLALCPDLYHGAIAKDDQEAGQLMKQLDWSVAVAELGAAVAHLRSHPRSNGKVGLLGFCMGGALTFAGALQIDGLACAVPFYGLPSVGPDALAKIEAPIQAHFAKNDDWAKASVAEEIQKKVRAAGGQMDLFVYDAGHAFMRDGDPARFDAASSKLAWERTLDFLKKHLG